MIKPVGSLKNVTDLGTKFLEKARLERLRLEVHLEAQEKEAEVSMIYEETEGDPSLSLMEMTIPMLVILAVIGLTQPVTWLCSATANGGRNRRNTMCIHRRQYRDEDELRTTTINVEDVVRLSVSMNSKLLLTSKEE